MTCEHEWGEPEALRPRSLAVEGATLFAGWMCRCVKCGKQVRSYEPLTPAECTAAWTSRAYGERRGETNPEKGDSGEASGV